MVIDAHLIHQLWEISNLRNPIRGEKKSDLSNSLFWSKIHRKLLIQSIQILITSQQSITGTFYMVTSSVTCIYLIFDCDKIFKAADICTAPLQKVHSGAKIMGLRGRATTFLPLYHKPDLPIFAIRGIKFAHIWAQGSILWYWQMLRKWYW